MNQPVSRRAMIQSLGAGLGSVALLRMLADEKARGENPSPHFPAKAKHSIVLFMPGGPSHVDMFDPKPALLKYQGQRPDAVDVRTERQTAGLLPSPFRMPGSQSKRARSLSARLVARPPASSRELA